MVFDCLFMGGSSILCPSVSISETEEALESSDLDRTMVDAIELDVQSSTGWASLTLSDCILDSSINVEGFELVEPLGEFRFIDMFSDNIVSVFWEAITIEYGVYPRTTVYACVLGYRWLLQHGR